MTDEQRERHLEIWSHCDSCGQVNARVGLTALEPMWTCASCGDFWRPWAENRSERVKDIQGLRAERYFLSHRGARELEIGP